MTVSERKVGMVAAWIGIAYSSFFCRTPCTPEPESTHVTPPHARWSMGLRSV
jgi:hypothetical protein